SLIHAMKFSPDGRYIVSGDDGGVAVIRETGNWMPIGTHQGANMIRTLEWHP
ncbi:hypothetical protein L208DRAFT_1217657, partial [Tricholoma matsutake]